MCKKWKKYIIYSKRLWKSTKKDELFDKSYHNVKSFQYKNCQSYAKIQKKVEQYLVQATKVIKSDLR